MEVECTLKYSLLKLLFKRVTDYNTDTAVFCHSVPLDSDPLPTILTPPSLGRWEVVNTSTFNLTVYHCLLTATDHVE